MLTVELHAHSELSYDGRDPVEKLLQQAAAVGLDGLAVTDHDAIEASLAAVELAPDYGLVGIPGMEVTSDAGHVLAIGVDELVPAGMSFADTIDRIHELGGIAIVPHPFQEFRSGVLANISQQELTAADAIEVFNSRLLTGRANRQAKRFARRNGMPMTAGSDAHIFEMIGQAVTTVDVDEPSLLNPGSDGTGTVTPDVDATEPPNTRVEGTESVTPDGDGTTVVEPGLGEPAVEPILQAIREGRTSVEGRRTPWSVSFRQAAGGVKRKMSTRVSSLFE